MFKSGPAYIGYLIGKLFIVLIWVIERPFALWKMIANKQEHEQDEPVVMWWDN